VTGLHVEAAGAGDAVVLVHAGICDSRMWEPQWVPYAARFRVVRYDRRGFGRSPLEPGRYSDGADLVALLEEHGPASIVGVSVGGRIALEAALARPELVERLVLVGAGLPDHDWSNEMRRADAEEEAALARGDLAAATELNVRFWVAGPRRSLGDVDPAVSDLVRDMQRRAFERQAGIQAEEVPLVPDYHERLAEVQAPTLLVVGEEDASDLLEVGERLERELPDVRLERIPATAHLPSLERPPEFDALVVPFLEAR
jgi:3-oxoadipate enol-lactonase